MSRACCPPDTISNGFDNVADAQAFSTTLMESYLRAAAKVTALAIGDKEAAATETNYRVPKTASQLSRVDGAPFGTRGGISVPHTFPADGDYVFKVELHSNACGVLFGGPNEGEQVEVSVDGERKAIMKIDPKMAETTTGLSLKTPQIHVTAGEHRVTAAFIQRFEGPVNDLIAPIDHTLADTQIGVALGITTLPHVKDFSIVGPYNVTGISDTASRRKIFTCRPTSAADEATCAGKIVRNIATQAFRGPVSDRDFNGADEVLHRQPQGRRLRIRDRRRDRSDPRQPAVPVPAREHADDAARGPVVSARAIMELASRLSYFIWGAAPDAELTKLASTRPVERARRLREAGRAPARGSALGSAVEALRAAVAASRRRRRRAARCGRVSVFRSHARRCVRQGVRAVLRQPRARRSQHSRSADGGLLVRQRAHRASLRHSERHRQCVPPRARCRPSAAAS